MELTLSILEPHWTEPIVTQVRSVTEITAHTLRETRYGYTLQTVSQLDIVHADGEREKYRVWPTTVVKVTLGTVQGPAV